MTKIILNLEDLPTTNRNIYELVLEKYKGNVSAFSKSIDIPQQNIDRLFKVDKRSGKYPAVSEDIINAIVRSHQISRDYLITEGRVNGMLSVNNSTDHVVLEEIYLTTAAGISYFKTPGGKFIMRVPMVPVYAYAKYVDEFRDANIWEGNGYSYFPVDQIYHGNYQAFEIKGDSMDDDSKRSLSHGDIVNARELSRDKWSSRLHTDQYPNWIIVTDTTVLCKQITNQNLETGEIICHSLNPSPEYADFTLNLNEVRKLFNIVQRVSSSF